MTRAPDSHRDPLAKNARRGAATREGANVGHGQPPHDNGMGPDPEEVARATRARANPIDAIGAKRDARGR